jgi:hypothetical protein
MRKGISMKKYKVFFGVVLCFVLPAGSIASEQNVAKIIYCSLPGGLGREVSFSIDNVTKEINYIFKKAGKIELNVAFNEENKLKRLTDSKMGVTYYGFNRGKYSYVIDIINGDEKEEYTMSFDIKKNNKVIQSSDCLQGSFRSDSIKNNYIVDVPYVSDNDFIFP